MDNAKTLSIRKGLGFAWKTYKGNSGVFTASILTFFLLWAILEMVVIAGQRFGFPVWLIAHISFFILFAGLEVGFTRICLALYDGESVIYSDIFRGLRFGAKFLLAQLAYLAVVLVGLVLLIIPGIYFGARYSFYGFHFTEGNKSLYQSFQESAVSSQGSMRFLFWTSIFRISLNIAGASILGIGLIVTIPLTVLMKTFSYRQINRVSN